MKPKAIVLASGGLDSTVAAYVARKKYEIEMLSVDYGQRHVREVLAAAHVARDLGVPHDIVDLSAVTKFLKSSALTDRSVDVPHGHYEAESMRATVVPNRNMILVAVAAAVASARGAIAVVTAVHAGDHFIYPDCRPLFVESLSAALAQATAGFGDVVLEAPFVNQTKAAIVRVGAQLDVPFSMTWSCYEGGSVHCGCCGTCTERKEAFHDAGIVDPMVYMS